jgi:hypothetical protein
MIVHQRERKASSNLMPKANQEKGDTASTASAENCTAQQGLAHASLSVQELKNGKTGSKKGLSSSGRHPKWKK